MRRVSGLVLGLILALAPALLAQVGSGSVYGTVTDDSGAVVPAAVVTLSGDLGFRETTTDSQGQFRFLNVDHGTHLLTVAMPGFSTVTREVRVSVGVSVTIDFRLAIAALEEVMTVTSETPLVDPKDFGTSVNISKEELASIPSSRDPWALMRTIPGVLVDRVNIAGSESGQQSYFSAKGSDSKDAVWSIDGVVVTDMAALGSSPGYYTYDTFDEVSFSTGGSGAAIGTGGIGINMVTKRGTNTFHGGFNGFFTHDDLQWGNAPSELAGDDRLQGNDKADHTEQIADWSIDLGGPIVPDKLWFYGSYGENDIRVKNLNQQRDKTRLINYSAKLNWQASSNDAVSLFWFLNEKSKVGRVGAAGSLTHLEGTRWDQGGTYPRHPHGLSKLEWNRVFSPGLITTVKASYYGTGFSLEPQGGVDDDRWIIDNVSFEARGTSHGLFYERPQATFSIDGSWFTPGWGGNHELKFGAGWRDVRSSTDRQNPGDNAMARFNPTSTRARFYRDAFTETKGEYWDAFLADTFTRERLTLTLGLRWELQRSRNLPSEVPASPLIPGLLPGIEYAGDGDWPVTWNTLSPRFGFSYALDESRRTQLHGSYAWYAGQLQNSYAAVVNPVASSFLEYDWVDANGDEVVQVAEVDFSQVRSSSNVDPLDPGGLAESPNRFDTDMNANRDHEVVIGLERELVPNLAASLAYTWRRSSDLLTMQTTLPYWYAWVGVGSSDYVRQDPYCEGGFCATPYVLDDAALQRADVSGGQYFTNRDDFAWRYDGVELSVVKRMADNWMGRLAVTWNDWTEDVGSGATAFSTPTAIVTDPKQDGGVVVAYGAGTSGKVYYMNAKWQIAANALYRLPRGFEVAASLFGRQGYPSPVYALLDLGSLDGLQYVVADGTEQDTQRFPDLWNLDLRLAKRLDVGERVDVTLSAEAFNVLNASTEMNRVNQFDAASYRRLDEILAPRIVRFGARLTF
jgi:hypothetical protein